MLTQEHIPESESHDYHMHLIHLVLILHTFSVSDVGTMWMSIDNLPAQLPREATDYFGQRLLPLVDEMVSTTSHRALHCVQVCNCN